MEPQRSRSTSPPMRLRDRIVVSQLRTVTMGLTKQTDEPFRSRSRSHSGAHNCAIGNGSTASNRVGWLQCRGASERQTIITYGWAVHLDDDGRAEFLLPFAICVMCKIGKSAAFAMVQRTGILCEQLLVGRRNK